MKPGDLRTTVRSLGRRSLAATLRKVPAGAFEPVRRSLPGVPASTAGHEARRRVLELVRHRGVPRDLDSFRLLDNPRVAIANGDSFIVERLYWFGERNGYEPEVVRWWRHYCRRARKILEVGANIGYFAVQGALENPSAEYTAVEPHPGAAKLMQRNLSLNRIANVRIVEAAAVGDDAASPVELVLPRGRDHYDEAPCTGFLITSEAGHPTGRRSTSVSVPAIAMKDLAAGVDLLKLDVEGQEHALLGSVEEYLASATPTMFVELLDGATRLRELIRALCESTSYRCLVPQMDALVPLESRELRSISIPERFGTRDIIVTRDDGESG